MGIINRRNAMLGWTAWRIAKRVMKQKARSAVPGRGDQGRRRPSLKRFLPALAALGAGVWFWNKRRSDDDFPPPGAAY